MGTVESTEELVSIVRIGWHAVVKMAKNSAKISQVMKFGKFDFTIWSG